MNGIILCQSKYGASRRYAEWIAEETGFRITETKKADIKEVAKYDVIILGGGVYASSIAGIAFLKKNIGTLSGKKIYVFCCGAAPYDEELVEGIRKRNLSGALSDIPLFYYQGMWDLNGMKFADRTMCKMYVKMLSKRDPAEIKAWERPFFEAKDKKCDWTDKKFIAPLIEMIKGKGEEKC